jgi:hypothetical protein
MSAQEVFLSDFTLPSKTSVDPARLLLRMLDRPGVQLGGLRFPDGRAPSC